MDPITLGILAIVGLGIIALFVGVIVVRAWIRTLKWMVKLAFYGFVTLLAIALVAGGAAWFLYGDAIRMYLAG